MPPALSLRTDYSLADLRRPAKKTKNNKQSRRLSLEPYLQGEPVSGPHQSGSPDPCPCPRYPRLSLPPLILNEKSRQVPKCAKDYVCYHLRRHLPKRGEGRRARSTPMQHRGDEPASGGDRHPSRSWGHRRPAAGSGGMAHVQQTCRACEHRHCPFASQVS